MSPVTAALRPFGPEAMAVGFAEALRERVEDGARKHSRLAKQKATSPRSLWRYAGETLGPLLLAAKDHPEFEDILEGIVESRGFHAIQVLWEKEWEAATVSCADCPLAKLPRAAARIPMPLRLKYYFVFGRKATAVLDEARWYGPAICSAVAKLENARTDVPRGDSGGGLDFLAWAPVAEAQALLCGLKGTAAHYAIAHAVFRAKALPRWLAQALATTHRNGSREYLRLLASDPGAGVSEQMVPVEERLDLTAIRSEARRVDDVLASLARSRQETDAQAIPLLNA